MRVVEIRDEYFVEDMRVLHNPQRLLPRLRDEILVTPKVELVEATAGRAARGKPCAQAICASKK